MLDKEQIAKDLMALIDEGKYILVSGNVEYSDTFLDNAEEIVQQLAKKAAKKIKSPKGQYHIWYARAYKAVRIFAPERLEEFEKFYTGDKTIKKIEDLNPITAGITHYLQGWIFYKEANKDITKDPSEINFYNTFESGLREQLHILVAMLKTIYDDLSNLESEIHYDIYQSEMDIAKDLRKKRYYRAAGSIAGVVVEVHLKKVVASRGIKLDAKAPTLWDYNVALKKHKIYDIATFSLVELCGQIRNKCVHPKEEEPTAGDISSIISAVERILEEVH